MNDTATVIAILHRLATLHKNAKEQEKRQLEEIARMVADAYEYSYNNMNLHLASMWP